ncbi:TetR/AcrR family transcriptional regulator [Kitasatospora sp. NA04385]|uniref:TetR/AcrR family transcriptional regulator n=1 Tax=Kitasatospora sp. NA04385 TaxID=2742135 RepID=UPI001590AB7A|nr:TetR/AcrR family transcriptional regulator [Kitasatospora sp. NA04385]QKW22246.1 TetR/AcrR family transcriptional regulator [Kitasatospora sp. NA04385]
MIEQANQEPDGPADETSTPVRPGRRRSEESRRAILAAAYELLGEAGYARLTVEGIAARAGTGKQTLYRWWPGKADVLLEAVTAHARRNIPLPDTGDHAADLHAFLAATFAAATPPTTDALRALMAEAQIDPAFGERFQHTLLRPRREALGTLTARAHAAGALAPHLTPATAVDLAFGLLWYRLLATREPLDDGLAELLTRTLLRA